MSNIIRSSHKFNNAQWPGGFAGLYPNGLVSAFFLNEAGNTANTGQIVTWDSLQQQPATSVALTVLPSWVGGNGGVALNAAGNAKLDCTNFSRAHNPQSWVFWLLPTANTCCIAAKNDANTVNQGFLLSMLSSGGIQLLMEGSLTRNLIVQCTNVPANWLSAWHHVAVTWNGRIDPSAVVQIYIDGILRANTFTQTDTAGAVYQGDAGQMLRLLYYNGAGTNWFGALFNGTLESLLMFNRPLSSTEIAELAAATYRWYRPRHAYAIVSPSQTFTATAAQKAGALGRKIFTSFAASAHTKAATLTAALTQFKTLTATAAQKAGTLTTAVLPQKFLTAQMLQRSGTLGRKVFITLSATKSTCHGVLTTLKAAAQKTLTGTASTKAGALNRKTLIGAQLAATAQRKQGKLTLAVQHGPQPPPVCTPVACPTVSTIISHVEQCENPGS